MTHETLTKAKIQSILWSPVSSIRKATEEERTLFPDKKDGVFYTFGLKVGQNFVMHFSSDKMTFRPINHLLPDIKEIRFPGYVEDTVVKFTSDLEDNERRKYCLYHERRMYADDEFERMIPIPLLDKAGEMQPLLQACLKKRNQLLSAQNGLKVAQAELEKFIVTGNKLIQKRSIGTNVPSKDHIKD